MAKAVKKTASKGTGKRTLIAPNDDKRYVKRNEKGQITESDDQGRSLSQDGKQTSKTTVKPGYGDRGDQPKKSAVKKAAPKKAAPVKAAPKKAAAKKAAPKKPATKKEK